MTENVVVAATEQDNRVSFELVNKEARTWKVLGCMDPQSIEYKNPPAPLAKDGVLRMEEGKFPLTDHRDLERFDGRGGTYVFTSVTGIRITGILDGFTYNCSPPGFDTGGTQIISVKIHLGLSTSPSVAEVP
jgi:hypothetical protein